MRRALESLLGLLDAQMPASVSPEDEEGPMGPALRAFGAMGFLSAAGMNPVPSCPHCLAGTPYRLGEGYRCGRCGAEVPTAAQQLRRVEHGALLGWLADRWGLRGGVEAVAEGLWRLGSLEEGARATECFYLRGRALPEAARLRLLAYRSVLVVHGKRQRPEIDGFDGRFLVLVDVLHVQDGRLVARPPAVTERGGGAVRFDRRTGALHGGDERLGRVPPGSREYHLLALLADHPGEVVPYADLKRHVCRAAGSRDETEEATFCHKLKSRIKRAHGVAAIDDLIRTDRRAGGYLLEAEWRPGSPIERMPRRGS